MQTYVTLSCFIANRKEVDSRPEQQQLDIDYHTTLVKKAKTEGVKCIVIVSSTEANHQ